MKYTGIDLHSNNSVVTVIDETDKVVAQKRLPNDLARILDYLEPYKAETAGVVVESTFNWSALNNVVNPVFMRVSRRFVLSIFARI